ncbi:MAG: prepilin-type N-terminal cleavage/methylation domain-containing protein [Patescibacteria group bacterium]|nr:prepilin-type N-terminal cleavage/methylation domain-containing protein [Patescibacteria group bacterium]
MRHRPNQRGFTIIETLIFLTVSASVFAGAISQYTGQQHEVQYRQGVRDIQSILQSTINEVSSSYAPALTGYHCVADPLNNPLSFSPGTPVDDNSGCVFLGKAIGVGNDSICNKDSIDSCSRYSIIPIAARRQYFPAYNPLAGGNQGVAPTSFSEAKPMALATCLTNDDNFNSFPCGTPGGGSTRNARPDLADRKSFANVGIFKAFVRNADGSSKKDIGAVAFVLRLNSLGGSINSVNLVELDSTAFVGNTESRVTDAIDGLNNLSTAQEAAQTNPPYGVSFCVLDGYGHQSVIAIGSNQSGLDVQVKSLKQDGPHSGCII